MAGSGRTDLFLGLDIGRVNTRVSVFGISEGKYRMLASKTARTDYGFEGHLAAGVHEALGKLQQELNFNFVHPSEREDGEIAINQQVVGQVGLSLSSLPQVNAVLFGLTAKGSLAAGLELAGKLPVTLAGAFGSADLSDEPAVLDLLIEARPDILILTGGEDSGAQALLMRWIEAARLICRVLPEEVKPTVFFAGNRKIDPLVRRRLEPTCRLVMLPNLQPVVGERDDAPSQAAISRHIISLSLNKLPGLQGLTQLAGDLVGTRGFALDRMVRYLSRSIGHQPKVGKSVLAIDIGAGSAMVCV